MNGNADLITWRFVVAILLSANLTLLGLLYRQAIRRLGRAEGTLKAFVAAVVEMSIALNPDKSSIIMRHMGKLLTGGGNDG